MMLTRKEKQAYRGRFLPLCGGCRERVTPGPIPNPEVKPLIADHTAPFRGGNVGRRRFEVFSVFFFFVCFLDLV